MKKNVLLFPLLLLTSCFASKNVMTFQIGEESGRLLYKGEKPFQANSKTFWKMNDYSCSLFCENEDIIFIENTVLVSQNKKPKYGAALCMRNREENCWDKVVFIPRDSLLVLGRIIDVFCPDSCAGKNTLMVKFETGKSREYPITFR